MKNKILLIIVLILSIFAVKSSLNKEKTTFSNDVINVSLKDTETNKIKNIDIENYIVGVIAAEMPASFEVDALKAQAVVARTYAIYKINNSTTDYDLVTDVTNQSYIDDEKMKSKWGNNYSYYKNKITDAVLNTKGEILTYNNEAICAFYFAMSNGYTEDSALVFGEKKEYIKSVESSFEKDVNNFEVINTISKTDFCQKLNIDCNNIIINNINRSKTNRVLTITINNKEYKGTELRKLLNLRSTDFDIDIINNTVNITTRGYGHGVGMSQYGANELAKKGYNYKEILNYYYKDVKINKINV